MMQMSFPDRPLWEPLHAVVPESWWGDFMFMGVAELPDLSIALYKHYYCRDYVNIDAEGQCYRFWHGPLDGEEVVSGYAPISREEALAPLRAFYEEPV